ncbi:hypothetical protein LCGC14_1433580 [marine sediment metagenome]|uniref:Uncharacterized protein n=1 Tax=marine sediment metagenome TaxID=412755 RepID=A0A0F9MPQ2_9ZZZZ
MITPPQLSLIQDPEVREGLRLLWDALSAVESTQSANQSSVDTIAALTAEVRSLRRRQRQIEAQLSATGAT